MTEKIAEEVRIPDRTLTIAQKVRNVPQLKELGEKNLEENITDLFNALLAGTCALKASDLHFEPEEERVRMRVRLDGVLHDVLSLDLSLYKSLSSRIKLLSRMKLNVDDRPQDGRFTILLGDETLEVRVSSLPSERGEAFVLRILDPKSIIEIEELGLRKDLYEKFLEEIKRPNGMIIVSGPTGSGKTTTLYAILKRVNKPETKIITIEDPIEYHLEGASQTQVAPEKGYDFASGLRSLMRQDPDVILVGEVRDSETGEIGVQAALTGHLVLTTLHTNDAAGIIPRLVNLGVAPNNIGPALNTALAQRLVRKVCTECNEETPPSPEEEEKIKNALSLIPESIFPREKREGLHIPRAKGCEHCNFTGYRGRVGIFEIFSVDDDFEKFILKNPSSAELREKAVEKGMIPMYHDGLMKVLQRETTLEEVERVTEE